MLGLMQLVSRRAEILSGRKVLLEMLQLVVGRPRILTSLRRNAGAVAGGRNSKGSAEIDDFCNFLFSWDDMVSAGARWFPGTPRLL